MNTKQILSLDQMQQEVGLWGEETFVNSTHRSRLEHLRDEVQELFDSEDEEEAADVFLILLHYCHRKGFSLGYAAAKKFEINKRRKWGKPDERGVVKHVDRT